jgi:hypothetical protein
VTANVAEILVQGRAESLGPGVEPNVSARSVGAGGSALLPAHPELWCQDIVRGNGADDGDSDGFGTT